MLAPVDIHSNLDSHYVLLEVPTDLWVLMYIELIVNIEWTYRIAYERSRTSFVPLLQIRSNAGDMFNLAIGSLGLLNVNSAHDMFK